MFYQLILKESKVESFIFMFEFLLIELPSDTYYVYMEMLLIMGLGPITVS